MKFICSAISINICNYNSTFKLKIEAKTKKELNWKIGFPSQSKKRGVQQNNTHKQ